MRPQQQNPVPSSGRAPRKQVAGASNLLIGKSQDLHGAYRSVASLSRTAGEATGAPYAGRCGRWLGRFTHCYHTSHKPAFCRFATRRYHWRAVTTMIEGLKSAEEWCVRCWSLAGRRRDLDCPDLVASATSQLLDNLIHEEPAGNIIAEVTAVETQGVRLPAGRVEFSVRPRGCCDCPPS